MKKKAFTMAELVITLTLIGSIAAFSVPPLITTINTIQYKVAFKENYSAIEGALNSIINDYGGNFKGICSYGSWHIDDPCIANLFAAKLSVTKVCGKAYENGCWNHKFQGLYDSRGYIFNPPDLESAIILSNGAILAFKMIDVSCNYSGEQLKDGCADIIIDIN